MELIIISRLIKNRGWWNGNPWLTCAPPIGCRCQHRGTAVGRPHDSSRVHRTRRSWLWYRREEAPHMTGCPPAPARGRRTEKGSVFFCATLGCHSVAAALTQMNDCLNYDRQTVFTSLAGYGRRNYQGGWGSSGRIVFSYFVSRQLVLLASHFGNVAALIVASVGRMWRIGGSLDVPVSLFWFVAVYLADENRGHKGQIGLASLLLVSLHLNLHSVSTFFFFRHKATNGWLLRLHKRVLLPWWLLGACPDHCLPPGVCPRAWPGHRVATPPRTRAAWGSSCWTGSYKLMRYWIFVYFNF